MNCLNFFIGSRKIKTDFRKLVRVHCRNQWTSSLFQCHAWEPVSYMLLKLIVCLFWLSRSTDRDRIVGNVQSSTTGAVISRTLHTTPSALNGLHEGRSTKDVERVRIAQSGYQSYQTHWRVNLWSHPCYQWILVVFHSFFIDCLCMLCTAWL